MHQFKIIVEGPEGDRLRQVRVAPYISLGAQNAYDYMPPAVASELGVTSTTNGVALMSRIRPKNLRSLLAKSERFGTQRFQLNEGADKDKLFSLRFRKVGRIEGQVVSENPEWLKSVRLWVESKTKRVERDQICLGQGIARTIKVDSDGKFQIPALATGSLTISASCDAKVPVYPRVPVDLTLGAGQILNLRIPLERTTKVTGRIVNGNGDPVPNAVLSIYGIKRQQSRRVTTDKDGRYSSSVLPGKVRVHVIAVDWEHPWDQKPDLRKLVNVPQQNEMFEFEDITVRRTDSDTK